MTASIDPRTHETFQEAIRSVYQSMEYVRSTRPGDRDASFAIGVTSAAFGDGKTTFAMALAGSLAEDLQAEVALVDADFRTHSIGSEYGLSSEHGFADVLSGRADMEGVSHRLSNATLSVIPAGHVLPDSTRLARSGDAMRFVENVKATYQYVVFDLPSVLTSSNGPLLAGLCDGVIVMAWAGRTTRRDLDQTVQKLRHANLLGVVVNAWDSRIPHWLEQTLALKP